jgi:hypothetical protein
MLAMWAAVIAALGLAWGLARHNPEKFGPFASGILFVLWPLVGGLFAWDFALLLAQFELKSALDPAAFTKAHAALKNVALDDGVSSAALGGAIGLHVIKSFAGSKK